MNERLAKAREFCEEAKILLREGRSYGVVNRAYYAMFPAARVALHSLNPELTRAKTRKTILSRFGVHIVVGGGLDPKHGRTINQALVMRLLADYESPRLDQREVSELVEQTEQFIAAFEAILCA